MISANDLKKGTLIKLEGKLYLVISYQHVKPGKGGAFVRTKLRLLEKNKVLDKTFRPDEKFEDAYLDRRPFQYLYEDGQDLVFMDLDSYEQLSVSREVIGDKFFFLKEGMDIEAELYEGSIINVHLSIFVIMEVVHTEMAVKGSTVGGSTKPAELETGYKVQVPLFVKTGDSVKIDTRTGEYMTRLGK